jgi:hypothetical protein
MALPTPSKTWEYKTNWFVYGGDSSDALAVAIMADVKDLLCDFIPRVGAYAEGSFTFSTPTVTYTAPDNRFDSTLIGNVVGKEVNVKGATTPGNDGTFTITAQTDNTLQWSNASGAAEALAGHLRIFNGDFTVPWQIDCTGQSTSHGSAGDGIDRIANDRTRMGEGGTSNCGFWTIKNPSTETYWSYSTNSNTSTASDKAARGVLRSTQVPFTMEAPPDLNSAPQGPLLTNGWRAHYEHNSNGSWLLYDWATGAPKWFITVMISSDGQQTRVIFSSGGYAIGFWMDGRVLNPVAGWTVGGMPTNPTFTAMNTSSSGTANGCEFGQFNDGEIVSSSKLPWNLPGLSYHGDTFVRWTKFYCTCEGEGSNASPQNLATINDITGEYDLYPIGLWSNEGGSVGRMGEIPDLWWHPTGLTVGNTFPENTTRTFMCLDNFVVPWNGDIIELAG